MEMLKIGFHILPKEEQLFNILGRKIRKEGGGMMMESADDDLPFPVIDRDLYSREPWELFTNEDPWEVDDSGEKTVKRTVYVFATLKVTGTKRFARIAGLGTWDGSTGEEYIPRKDDGPVIGSKRYLDYKPKQESSAGLREIWGHWMMHEYKLAGESLKGLESTVLPLANVRVLCKISQVVDKGSLVHCLWPKEPLDRCLEEYISQGLFETITSNEDSQLAVHKRECPDQEIKQQENPKRRRIMQNQKIQEEKGYSTNSSTLNETENNLFDSKEKEEEFTVFLENSLTDTETCLSDSKKEEEKFSVNVDKSLTETETCKLFDSKEEDEEFPVIVDNSLTMRETCNLFDLNEEEEEFAVFLENSLTEETCLSDSQKEEENFLVNVDKSLTETETFKLFDSKEDEAETVPVIVDNSQSKREACNLFDSKEEEEKFAAFIDNALTEIETCNLFNPKEEEEEYAAFLDTWLNE